MKRFQSTLSRRSWPYVLCLQGLLTMFLGCGDSSDDAPNEPPVSFPDAAPLDAAPPDATPPDAVPTDAAPPDAIPTLTYVDDILPIWQNRCVPCHFGPNPIPPDMGASRQTLLELASFQVNQFSLIEPGAPSESYLWLKLNDLQGDLSSTDPMPQPNLGGSFTPIPAYERTRIEAWILSGAGDSWQ